MSGGGVQKVTSNNDKYTQSDGVLNVLNPPGYTIPPLLLVVSYLCLQIKYQQFVSVTDKLTSSNLVLQIDLQEFDGIRLLI